MEINAKELQNARPYLEYGSIEGVTQGIYHVLSDFDVFDAKRSISCIIEPRVGDRVLVCADDTGSSYILSVLDRQETTHDLTFDGNVRLNVRGGSLSIASEEDIEFASKGFMLSAKKARVQVEETSFFSRIVENHIEKLKLIAETMDSIIRRVVGRFTSSYRYIEEHEEIQSASTRMIVDGTLTMHTKNTMHIAEGNVKIDAGQIHLG